MAPLRLARITSGLWARGLAAWTWRETRKHGHGALIGAKATLDVKRLPGTHLVRLGDAPRVLAAVSEGRLVQDPGNGSGDVRDDELDRSTDGGIGSMARTEDTHRRVQSQLFGDGTGYDRQNGAPVGAGGYGVKVELGLAHGPDGRQNHGEVLGETAGHDGVCRHLLGGYDSPPGRLHAHDLRW